MDYSGGWLWMVMDVVLVAVLALALAYGIRRYRLRYRSDRVEERSAQHDARRHEALRR